MIERETKIRVIYGDTDKMGYVYYGNYPKYYERGRTETLRDIGLTYKELEAQGIGMPVFSMNIKYLKPSFYDDVLTVKTKIFKLPQAKIYFEYEIYNQDNVLVNYAETTLVFIDTKKNKPTRAPEFLINKMKPYFE
ncbi:MAG: thioesterase family protein [Bacteroidota bacterium]|nr:thioesterase family protein [Bacteroidota bacterium]